MIFKIKDIHISLKDIIMVTDIKNDLVPIGFDEYVETGDNFCIVFVGGEKVCFKQKDLNEDLKSVHKRLLDEWSKVKKEDK